LVRAGDLSDRPPGGNHAASDEGTSLAGSAKLFSDLHKNSAFRFSRAAEVFMRACCIWSVTPSIIKELERSVSRSKNFRAFVEYRQYGCLRDIPADLDKAPDLDKALNFSIEFSKFDEFRRVSNAATSSQTVAKWQHFRVMEQICAFAKTNATFRVDAGL